MAERIIDIRRKSQAFVNNLAAPVTESHVEIIREKLECGAFPITKTGLIKIIGLTILLLGLSLFLAQDTCKNTDSWYPYLYPSCLGINIVIQITLFLIFSFGLVVNNPWLWIRIDIFVNLFFSVLTVISSTLTNINCTESGTLAKLPGPIGIVGGIVLIVSCAAIFLLYRYKKEDEIQSKEEKTEIDTRKSVFA